MRYDRFSQCQIIDASQVKYLQSIKEEEEHEQEAHELTREMVALGLTQNRGSPSKQERK